MTRSGSAYSCQTKCWGLAAATGFVALILARSVGGYGWGTSIFLGLLVVVLLGLLLTWLMCSDVPKLGHSTRAKGISSGAGTAGAGSGSDIPMSVAGVSGTGSASPTAKASTADAVATKAPESAPAAPKADAQSAADTSSGANAETTQDKAAEVDKAPAKASDDAAAEAKSSDAATFGEKPANGSVVKPSAALAGQTELSSRKGSWKYEADKTATKPDSAAKPVEASATSADSGDDYDGDGELEGAAEGTKPETLTEARAGGADNLKEIKGVGPKLETLLNELGFYHFDQIASWNADEVAWVNANLSGFKGRVSRDDWVEQAKVLAAGGDTEFSKRVDKGDVY